jgi:hypothetical protein
MTAIGKWFCRMGSEETPHVEVLDPVLAIQEVQCGSLAERYSEQATTVTTSRSRVMAKEGRQVFKSNMSEAAQVSLCDLLLGAHWTRHERKYSGRNGPAADSGHYRAVDSRFDARPGGCSSMRGMS